MRTNSPFLTALSIPAVLSFTILFSGASHAADYDPSRVHWSKLNYFARVFIFSLDAEAELKSIPIGQSRSALLEPGNGIGVMPQADPTYVLHLRSQVIGRDSLLKLWFDPDGSAFQRKQIETGMKDRVKIYRLLEDGYYSKEIKPKNGDEEYQPWTQWSDVHTGGETFAKMPPGNTIITEPTALFYLISASPLEKPGDRMEQHIFTKHGINVIELKAVKMKDLEVDYRQAGTNGNKTIAGKTKALHIKLNARPLDPEKKDSFEFLGLKGAIDLYVDPQSRVLLQLSGKADIVGRVDIKLTNAVLKN